MMESHKQPPRDGAQAIHRAAALLREIATFRGPGADLARLSRSLSLSRGTTHRILTALAREGLLEKEGPLYRLGPVISELGLADASLRRVTRATQPVLQVVASELEGYAAFNLRSAGEAVCIDFCDRSVRPRKLPMTTGNRRPLGVGSASLAILAQMPREEVADILSRYGARYHRYGLTPEQVAEAVDRVRENGYAVSTGRFVPGYRGVSLGFRIDGGRIGSVTISNHATQFTTSEKPKVIAMLRWASQELGRDLVQLHWTV